MIKLVDSLEYYKQKDLFIRFAKIFMNMPKNDFFFVLSQKKLLENEPELTSYTYQLAFDTCFKKKIFNARDIEQIFENKFQIVDLYRMNGNDCDSSTINSAFIVDRLKTTTSEFKDISVKIFNAPLEYQTKYYYNCQKQSFTKDIVAQSKKFVGQTNPDLQIGDRVEDIKHYTASYIVAKNILQSWTYERIEKDFNSFMLNYCNHFKNVSLTTNKDVFSQNFYKKLVAIQKDTTLSIYDKNKIWNVLFADNWFRLDKNVPTPLILQMTHQPYTASASKYLHENLHIPADVLDNQYSVRKVIYDVVNIMGEPYKFHAEQMTEGLLSEKFIDSSLEVD